MLFPNIFCFCFIMNKYCAERLKLSFCLVIMVFLMSNFGSCRMFLLESSFLKIKKDKNTHAFQSHFVFLFLIVSTLLSSLYFHAIYSDKRHICLQHRCAQSLSAFCHHLYSFKKRSRMISMSVFTQTCFQYPLSDIVTSTTYLIRSNKCYILMSSQRKAVHQEVLND